jgi:hypothetical protein
VLSFIYQTLTDYARENDRTPQNYLDQRAVIKRR